MFFSWKWDPFCNGDKSVFQSLSEIDKNFWSATFEHDQTNSRIKLKCKPTFTSNLAKCFFNSVLETELSNIVSNKAEYLQHSPM